MGFINIKEKRNKKQKQRKEWFYIANSKVLTKQCIAMLEKYYPKAQNLPNNNKKVLNLEAQDLKDWKNTYYPELVKSGLIRDGEFF